MTPADQIRLNALLLEREGEFLRVHELERAAAAILGEPYPFAQPPLPSNQPRRSGKAKRKPGKGGEGAEPARLRRLDEPAGEIGYRVVYVEGGSERVETYPAGEALQTLLAAQGARLQVRWIATVDASGATRAELFRASPSA